MFKRPTTWIVISLLCLAGSFYFWQLGERWSAERNAARSAARVPPATAPARSPAHRADGVYPAATAPMVLLTTPAQAQAAATRRSGERNQYQLRNTARTAGELLRDPQAVLLENALIDTRLPLPSNLPPHLRAAGEPGSYIVQARGDYAAFRAALERAGGQWVSYIPNNAALVRASASVAQQLASVARVQSVLPFEPYYKFKAGLLAAAVKQEPMPPGRGLSLVLFSDAAAATKQELTQLGAKIVAEEPTPFGPLVRVTAAPADWYTVARLSGVQTVESWQPRVPANDRSRVRVAVSTDTLVPTNYLNLSGSNVMVALVDSGVDATHPDLTNRLFADALSSLVDSNGHGTHVAGIIGGSGVMSTNPVNVGGILESNEFGSVYNASFRGKAQAAKLFVMPLGFAGGRPGQDEGGGSDAFYQERAAETNALISNNSWYYANQNNYSIAAASYDAAVRDALPGVTGSQPVQFVFAAGNTGGGEEDNLESGASDSIMSPGTAKNVITVGALEQLRNITNAVIYTPGCTNITVTNIVDGQPVVTNVLDCPTNYPWKEMTSSESQVAWFSSRGNVGIGVEGDFGRFKPDLVAPGTFVVSTRSAQWDEIEYYNPTNHHILVRAAQSVEGTNLHSYVVSVPNNAVGLDIALFDYTTNLPIYVWQGTDYSSQPFDFVRTNFVFAPPDGGPNFGPVDRIWTWAVGNPPPGLNQSNAYAMVRDLITTNDLGNYFEVLKDLNDSITTTNGRYYRFESGTSMSAADVSGMLALMQQFFAEKLQRTNSPALMKALLINGARPVGGGTYDLNVRNTRNYQGWGLPRLRNSIPGGLTNFNANQPSSMWFVDQSPTNALATGQSQTRTLTLPASGATNLPLRVTLVWTDPPGNPNAGVKLVNDLDLIVTNRVTGDVYFGNDIPAFTTFTEPWDTNLPPSLDSVNNVENVFLQNPLDTNYSITVVARAVNVNAVTGHTNDVVQDYALVISSGDGQIVSAITFGQTQPIVTPDTRRLTYVTNTFNQPDAAGFLLDGQRVGANTPLLGTTNGMTNQWRFYVVTNTTSYSNAAFITFLSIEQSVPRIGTREATSATATRRSADIDLYVSEDPDLTNLVPAAVNAANRSRLRIGTEQVVYSNSVADRLYYLGVKSEDYMAAEFSLFGVFSLLPFGDEDGTVRCFNIPTQIPDRTPDNVQGPGNAARVICPCVLEGEVRRVIVTNVFFHEHFGDVIGVLDHESEAGDVFAVLNNHRPPPVAPAAPGPYGFIYEDLEGGLFAPAGYYLLPSDGPQSLLSFMGEQRVGPWIFTFVDDSLTATGLVDFASLRIEESDLTTNSPPFDLPPGGWRYDVVNVPACATNLTLCVFGNNLPVGLYIRRGALPTLTTYDKFGLVGPPSGCLSLTTSDLPPLSPGRYFVGIHNPNATALTNLQRSVTLEFDPNCGGGVRFSGGDSQGLLDDAVTNSVITVTNDSRISSVEVGLRVDHPRVSDLAFTLISPRGTRVLLMENRGRTNENGIGSTFVFTNVVPVAVSNAGPQAVTNVIPTGNTSGNLRITYDFFIVPDRMTVYYQNTLLLDSGFIAGSGTFNVSYGPGTATEIMVVMNEGGNPSNTTAYAYTVSDIGVVHSYLTFTENTNLTTTPIKFIQPPFIPPPVASLLVSGFEPPTAVGDYPPLPGPLDGWSLLSTNPVTVFNDPVLVHAGVNSLALHAGAMERILTTIPGRSYRLSFAQRQQPRCFEYTNFNTTAGLTLVGSPTVVGTDLRLTPSAFGQRGGAWYTSRQKCSPGFTSSFQFRMSDLVAGGGDGIWMGVQNESVTGPGWEHGTDTSAVGITFNTYLNPGEPSDNFVSVSRMTAGGLKTWIPPQQSLATINLSDGNIHTAQITYDGSAFTLVLDGQTVLNNVVTTLDPGVDANGYGWVGFGARTGIAWENHDILNWTYCSTESYGGALVAIPGLITNTFTGTTNWQTNTVFFTASATTTPLLTHTLAGESGVLLDTFTLTESAVSLYALPEESLTRLTGENARGDWRLEIWDSRTGKFLTNVLQSWQLNFVFQNTAVPGVLEHGVPKTNSIPPGQIAYYIVDVPIWALFATNYLSSDGGPLELWFNQGTPPTTTNVPPEVLLFTLPGAGANSTTLGLATTPPLQPGQRYYLGVKNTGVTTVNYVIGVDFDITPLTNGVPVTSTLAPGFRPRYFSYDVSTNANAVSYQLFQLDGNVNLVARRGPPVPTTASYDYGSFAPGTNDEDIVVFTNSTPVALAPGRWYLGVFNADVAPVTYTILATEYSNLPPIITLTNGIPYYNTNSGTGLAADYYRYVVTTNAVRAQFEINGPSGDLTLVVKKGLPLPDLALFDYLSANPYTNDEVIVVVTNSSPVPLTPGDWFLTALNLSGAPAGYAIKATEWPLTGRPLIVTGANIDTNGFCITWDSLPGVHYFVEGLTNLNSTNWVVASPTITAVATSTTYCVPLPSPLHFFRVREGVAVNPFVPPPLVNLTVVTNGILLEWRGPLFARYGVDWSPTLLPPAWSSFTNIITSTNGVFQFLDDGSQSGGLGGTKFYRVYQVP